MKLEIADQENNLSSRARTLADCTFVGSILRQHTSRTLPLICSRSRWFHPRSGPIERRRRSSRFGLFPTLAANATFLRGRIRVCERTSTAGPFTGRHL